METIKVNISRNEKYDILIENGLLTHIGELFQPLIGNRKIIIVTDERVNNLYGFKVEESLKKSNFICDLLKVPEGETSKSLEMANYLFSKLVDLKIGRRDIILALGGGMITDLAGFVAATYMRGIPYVNVPTTLLAQHDSSIGGKVAVNYGVAKNLIGAFYHPKGIYIDPSILTTLANEEIKNGLAEAVKIAIINSPSLFKFIEENYQSLLDREVSVLYKVVVESAKIKAYLVSLDPYENELRRDLNFGHTIGHAVETETTYQAIKHGEAISMGMATATRIATQRRICSLETRDRIINLLSKIGLPTLVDAVEPQHLWRSISIIKLIRGGEIHFVIPQKIGKVIIVDDLTEDELSEAIVNAD
ncbi:MAG: 3-dehydroquinate synthase [bacterium]|nr:3-dehydroquinate synthase [bacterium]